jgi:hypothetical protein
VDDQLDGDKQFGRRMVLLPLISMRAFLKEAIAMKAINYEAPAGLWKEFFGEIAPGKVAHLCSIEVARGTLRSCVAQFDAKPGFKKGLYSSRVRSRLALSALNTWMISSTPSVGVLIARDGALDDQDAVMAAGSSSPTSRRRSSTVDEKGLPRLNSIG